MLTSELGTFDEVAIKPVHRPNDVQFVENVESVNKFEF